MRMHQLSHYKCDHFAIYVIEGIIYRKLKDVLEAENIQVSLNLQ